MLSGLVRILNFDHSVVRQKKLLEKYNPVIIDLSSNAGLCRHWLNKKTASQIISVLSPQLRNAATLIGSGDFHHISSLLIEQFRDPINVIIFDYHPDWDILPPKLGCGSWVTNILKNHNIQKVILLGVSSGDISSSWFHTGNFNSLKNNRLELYPYTHKPTQVVFRSICTDNVSLRVLKGFFCDKIYWRELKDMNLEDFMLGLLSRLETKQVYVSIDKDCLKPSYALTNWEAGCFELGELISLLKLIKQNMDIVGLDITGEYSPPQTHGALKAIFSRWDHPKDYSAKSHPQTEINLINEETNIKILELLMAQ
jgi:hypothetical protein